MNKKTNQPSKRLFKALTCGFVVGVFVVLIFALPLIIIDRNEHAASVIKQANLVAARGEVFSNGTQVSVSITPLLNGKKQDSIAISADGSNWFMPQNGVVNLSLEPDMYEFQAAYENRVVALTQRIEADQKTNIVLDISKAPSVQELVFLELSKGESRIFPLNIGSADDVEIFNAPSDMKIVKEDGGYALFVDGNLSRFGFFPIALTAKNEYGQATAHIGVRILRDESPTPIHSVEDLRNIRYNLSGSYILMNDLDMSGVDDWTIIGTEKYPFTGIFDGNGYEITGFHSPETILEDTSFSLIGHVMNAEVKNVIVREPYIRPTVPSRASGVYFSCSVIGGATYSLLENCAVIGGIVEPTDGASFGLAVTDGSIVIGLFNSAKVICHLENRYLPNTGGVLGGAGGHSYIAFCANEGEVKGDHLTGGIVGFNHSSEITKCINSGYVWGSTLVGEFPTGGIMQTTDFGSASCSYFVKRQSGIGGKAFYPGVINSLIPIEMEDLRNKDKLVLLGDFDGAAPAWAYASLDANGPIPYGIFRKQTEAPRPILSGDLLEFPATDGIRYFYTTDGSDPYTGNIQASESMTFKQFENQQLTVYAARKGYRDSDIISMKAEGGK